MNLARMKQFLNEIIGDCVDGSVLLKHQGRKAYGKL
jgi:hypothetical protein